MAIDKNNRNRIEQAAKRVLMAKDGLGRVNFDDAEELGAIEMFTNIRTACDDLAADMRELLAKIQPPKPKPPPKPGPQ